MHLLPNTLEALALGAQPVLGGESNMKFILRTRRHFGSRYLIALHLGVTPGLWGMSPRNLSQDLMLMPPNKVAKNPNVRQWDLR